MDIHNIGGLRRLGRWETADISIIVFVYRQNQLVAQKIGLLQSKRWYPTNNDVDDDDPVGFLYGMNAFLRRQPNSPLALLNRQFAFTADCIYGAVKAGDDQIDAMASMNAKLGNSLFYMFYNPPSIPTTIINSGAERHALGENILGCRVCSESEVKNAMAGFAQGRSLKFSEVEAATTNSNWRLEKWAADLLLTCKVGQQFDAPLDELISSLLVRRTGPIGASIAISIALPEQAA